MLKLTGYLASAAALVWTTGQSLNSATDNEWTDLCDELDNSLDKRVYVDLYIELGSAAFTGTDSGIEIYLVKSVDGTNYPTWTGNVTTDKQENNGFYVDFVSTTGTTAAQKMATSSPILLPNGKFKWGLRNRGNVTLASSGNAVYMRPHSFVDA